MGCGSCGSGGCSSNGCGQKGGCATGGCNKLNTYDWLNNMLPPDQSEVDNVYEVRFKGTRKAFYRNVNGLRLFIGDHVVVESDRGYDIGTLSLGGVLAELQMRKKNVRSNSKDIFRIYRKANDKDLELMEEARKRDHETLVRSREIVLKLKLDMKISEVEYQADNAKAIFYYIADHRVDFRDLIKELAREFHIRVEMKQIGLRHEAGLLGGIGSCGRELCCSTWLTEFETVSTSAARYQNLSLNPMKISGLCGRLKCCLNYELDAYLDALEGFPEVNSIDTQKGRAYVQKTDIFKGIMWFSYPGETTWYPLHIDSVQEVIKLNQQGERPPVFTEGALIGASDRERERAAKEDTISFVDGVGTTILKENPGRSSQRGKGRKGKSRQDRQERSDRRGTAPQAGEKTPEGSTDTPRRSRRPERNSGRRLDEGAGKAAEEKAGADGKSPERRGRNRPPQSRQKPKAPQAQGEPSEGAPSAVPSPAPEGSAKPRQGRGRGGQGNRNSRRRSNNRGGRPPQAQEPGSS